MFGTHPWKKFSRLSFALNLYSMGIFYENKVKKMILFLEKFAGCREYCWFWDIERSKILCNKIPTHIYTKPYIEAACCLEIQNGHKNVLKFQICQRGLFIFKTGVWQKISPVSQLTLYCTNHDCQFDMTTVSIFSYLHSTKVKQVRAELNQNLAIKGYF